MSWGKLPPVKPFQGCRSQSTNIKIGVDAMLAVGLGGVTIRKDDEILWSGDEPTKTLREYEELAQQDPDHDWRVEFYAPLSSSTYQRQGFETWICIETDQGFA